MALIAKQEKERVGMEFLYAIEIYHYTFKIGCHTLKMFDVIATETVKKTSIDYTGKPSFIAFCFIILYKYYNFYRLKVCDSPA
jgi:hypothetical protein